ncbi:MAG: anti-sigma factor C-terminal domain-containing protein [Dehalococcoidia bacterium]|nr:anti-sigma factor C-terminal domain-containing protein [Dehalococcoidia bacterium]
MGSCSLNKPNKYYDPNSDIRTSSCTFATINQLLSPYTTESHLDQGKVTPYFTGFRLLNIPFSKNPNISMVEGNFNFKFGKGALNVFADRLGHDLTCLQSVFLTPNVTQDYWQSISDDEFYEVWIAFDAPIGITAFIEKYDWLLDNSTRFTLGGISWIPVKTSDDVDDVCIGMAGNLSWHALTQGFLSPYDLYNTDLYGRELVFRCALQFLIDHPNDTNAFIETGLWADADTINFEERYEYTQQNGIQYLGFVAYMKGSVLRTLENDSIEIVYMDIV